MIEIMVASEGLSVSDVMRSFIKFLQFRNAYGAWCNEVCKVWGITYWAEVAQVIEDGDYVDLLSGMIVWEDTPQGHSYWKGLSLEWECICLKWK